MSDQEQGFKVFFVGAGMMAGAMVRSLLRQGQILPSAIGCCSAKDGTAERLSGDTGITVIDVEAGAVVKADVVVLACKPQQLASISPETAQGFAGSLLISILAGTPIAKLKARFPMMRAIVRAMPNTPGSIGAGITAWASDKPLSSSDTRDAREILGSLGEILPVAEDQIDAITAISGSGPAYLFLFTEALASAAETLGFDPETALKLARSTIQGSARLMESCDQHPSQLRRQVTSPGGTTQAAIESFEKSGFTETVMRAATCARDRSIELSRL